MTQKWIYLIQNMKTREIIWALSPCKGWRTIDRKPYSFTQVGVC
jgi:hypothetical protein